MAGNLSLKLGNWLYNHAFGIYNQIYPIFKNKQDKHEIAFILEHLKPGSTVLDIGANIGFYSRILSKATGPKGMVHCFEPDTTNFKHLKNNTATLQNVVVNNLAVSSSNEPIKIYLSKELNVDHRTYPVDDFEKAIEIKATSIDHYLSDNQTVDFVKMDIQGYEIEALNGMKKTVENSPNIQLVMEFWPHGLSCAGFSVKDLIAKLDELGLAYRFMDHENVFDLARIAEYETWGKEKFTNLYAFKK